MKGDGLSPLNASAKRLECQIDDCINRLEEVRPLETDTGLFLHSCRCVQLKCVNGIIDVKRCHEENLMFVAENLVFVAENLVFVRENIVC